MTLLPEVLNCYEFVNADEIARGLSQLNPNSANIQAGKLMLNRIEQLMRKGVDFAFETTLASKSFVKTIEKAKHLNYRSTLIFFYLESVELAIKRVEIRVKEGGHNIPKEVILRRYESSLKNFFKLYKDKVDNWKLIESKYFDFVEIASLENHSISIYNHEVYNTLKRKYEAN